MTAHGHGESSLRMTTPNWVISLVNFAMLREVMQPISFLGTVADSFESWISAERLRHRIAAAAVSRYCREPPVGRRRSCDHSVPPRLKAIS